ncbi:MAG: ferritin [Deltaproteobacteria bacterium]|nr:MAG: ferritin [Deltaproteobacteria bacterium]
MIGKKAVKELNKQINAEMFSAYFYLSMSAWCEHEKLPGFANWMRIQAQEEMDHAMKMFDYLLERGGVPVLDTIDKPQAEWDSILTLVGDVEKHEQYVTGLINDLVDCALKERDHALNYFLQWFVEEQVEEEASVGAVYDRLKMIGDDSSGLVALDMEMAKRVYTPPAEGEK